MAEKVKQVLIWRNDLRNAAGHKVRTGKIAAQLAHASMAVLLNRGEMIGSDHFEIYLNEDIKEWLTGRFTKICVCVDNEDELRSIYQEALNAGIPCSLIKDAGLTEFDGIPTYTAVAIGPAKASEIDKITGNLKLL